MNSNLNLSLFSLSSPQAAKISLWQLITLPFKLLFINWQSFFLIAVPTALLLSAVSFLFGRSALCGIGNDFALASQLCQETAFSFYGDAITRLTILMIFAAKWYHSAILKQPFSFKNLFTLNKGTLKAFGFLTLFAIINCLPLIAGVILFIHQPYPDWRQELLFFTSVAWVFLLPLLAIRFYSVIAFALENVDDYSFKAIWQKTSGNMLKLLLGTAAIVFLALFIFMQYYGAMQATTDSRLIAAVMYEFEYDVLMTSFIALCTNYCYTQKELLFKEQNHE